ncbi:MAG TPA: hypothetical protein GX530_10360, partial [Corynebacteriales bacterium]|nr:hypothetical protein [Mycobacteriales bacterium]
IALKLKSRSLLSTPESLFESQNVYQSPSIEIQELKEEIENLEAEIKRKCDCLEAEVLMRRFRYNQFWTVIAKEMKQTVFYVQKFYDSGLEKFGRN